MSTCVRCGGPGTERLAPLELFACKGCEHVWLNDSQMHHTAIEAVVGKFTGTGYAAHMKRFVAELLKRTESWARAWRAAV